jgi:hypothetical protein
VSATVSVFRVNGPDSRVDLVQRAVASLDADVDIKALHPKTAEITFGNVSYIPGTNQRAAGYTVSGPNYRIRHGMADAPNLSKGLTKYVVIHEALGHGRLILRPLTDGQKRRALALLDGPALPKFIDPDEVWRKVPGEKDYWLRPYECIIDSLVEALTDMTSPLKPQYRRHVRDLAALKALWLEPPDAVVQPPPDVVEPPPLPEDEPDAATTALAQVAAIVQPFVNTGE